MMGRVSGGNSGPDVSNVFFRIRCAKTVGRSNQSAQFYEDYYLATYRKAVTNCTLYFRSCIKGGGRATKMAPGSNYCQHGCLVKAQKRVIVNTDTVFNPFIAQLSKIGAKLEEMVLVNGVGQLYIMKLNFT